MKTSILCGLLVMVTASSVLAGETVKPSDDETDVIAAVLTMLLDEQPADNRSANDIILRSTTYQAWDALHLADDALKLGFPLDPKLVQAYRATSAASEEWDESLKLPNGVRLVDRAILRKLMKEDGWPRVQKEFRGARQLVSISRAGLSDDHKSALIYFESGVTGPLSGGGALLLMQKSAKGWTREKVVVGVVY